MCIGSLRCYFRLCVGLALCMLCSKLFVHSSRMPLLGWHCMSFPTCKWWVRLRLDLPYLVSQCPLYASCVVLCDLLSLSLGPSDTAHSGVSRWCSRTASMGRNCALCLRIPCPCICVSIRIRIKCLILRQSRSVNGSLLYAAVLCCFGAAC